MSYLVWRAASVGNACTLEPLINVDQFYFLKRGTPFNGNFPADAYLEMSKSFKKDTRLVDDVINGNGLKICSRPLVDFLRAKDLKHLEYLPVTIRDHKNKVASTEYCIVHTLGLQDALDLTASGPHYNSIVPTDIDTVDQLIIDDGRIDSTAKIFRLARFSSPVLIDRELADEIKKAGFVGSRFKELKDVRS